MSTRRPITAGLRAAFAAVMDLQDVDECIPWRGHNVNEHGYGVVWAHQQSALAHRVAYSIAHPGEDLPPVVRHSCDNPPCVNPRHLLAGTQADNVRDCISRGRFRDTSVPIPKCPTEKKPRGSHNGNSKLTEAIVAQILATPGRQVDLALQFGVSQANISDIRRRKLWRHVEPAGVY